ncbi:hypothetical protein HPGCJGGD_3156 [Methylobacterium haplocladii]|nr:hypothetical protein HPGCJGGD_3156 [Methylobacterium haplocladii]
MLPNGAAPAFRDWMTLWRAVDARGTRAQADGDGRGGVTGLELLLGLPRLGELTLEEMADLVRSFCTRFLAERLAVQWDIHAPEPRLQPVDEDGVAVAVHAHVLVSGRPLRGDRVLPRRNRLFDPVARPGYHRTIGWPREWRRAQERFFSERGIAMAVASPWDAGERPLGRFRFAAERRAALADLRQTCRDRLRDPGAVITVLLRDHWTFRRADLAALLSSVFSDREQRDSLARAVLSHPSLQLARSSGGVPCWTTAHWAHRAARAIAAAAATRPVVHEPDEDRDTSEAWFDLPWPDELPPSRFPGVCDGETCTAAVLRLADQRQAAGQAVTIAAPTTVAYARMEPVRAAGHAVYAAQALTRPDHPPAPIARPILVPFADALTDPDLVALLAVAEASGAPLYLLPDPEHPMSARPTLLVELQERGLLAALPDAAGPLRSPIAPHWQITPLGSAALAALVALAASSGRPIVATGATLVRQLAARIRASRVATGEVDTGRQVTIGRLPLSPGDRIFVVSAWDRAVPPRPVAGLRAGTHLSIVDTDMASGTVTARGQDGETVTLANGTSPDLVYDGALTLRSAISTGVTDARLVLDDPQTVARSLQLHRAGPDDVVWLTPEVAAAWDSARRHRAGAAPAPLAPPVPDRPRSGHVDDDSDIALDRPPDGSETDQEPEGETEPRDAPENSEDVDEEADPDAFDADRAASERDEYGND